MVFSCQKKEEVGIKPNVDYDQIIRDYNSVFKDAFDQVSRANIVSTISISETSRVLRLSRKETQTVTATFLNSNGFPKIEFQSHRANDALTILSRMS